MTDKNQSTESVESKQLTNRRRALKKLAGGSVAGLLTVAHRPALGAVCMPSGHISNVAHISSALNTTTTTTQNGGCGSLAKGSWQNPYAGNNQSDWSAKTQLWLSVDYNPKRRNNNAAKSQHWDNTFGAYNNPNNMQTKFREVFGTDPLGGNTALENIVNGTRGSDLDQAATEALLNAKLNGWDGTSRPSPNDVIGLYNACLDGVSYTMTNNTVVKFDVLPLTAFFEGLIDP